MDISVPIDCSMLSPGPLLYALKISLIVFERSWWEIWLQVTMYIQNQVV